MYFAIIGKNSTITEKEMEIINPKKVTDIGKGMISFETQNPEFLDQLAGIIKWGIIVSEDELGQHLEGQKIVGVPNMTDGKARKKLYGFKRFKETTLQKTDREIRNKGIEVIAMPKSRNYGVVKGYQNIPLYEAVDFDKPQRSMEMGMMPSKLTHIMINIALNLTANKKDTTIYDPFSGSGTTGFLANYFHLDFIGSDINILPTKQNFQRRKTHRFYNNQNDFEFFQQDATQNITQQIPENTVIVSEGRLGPIVGQQTSHGEVKKFQKEVLAVYKGFLSNIKRYCDKRQYKKLFPTVITIPYYLKHYNFLESELQKNSEKLGLQLESIEEVYSRKGQHIGRKILIIR